MSSGDFPDQLLLKAGPLSTNKRNWSSFKILITTGYYLFSFGITSDIIFNSTTGIEAFDFTVIVLAWIPLRPEVSKTTSILPLPPGRIGFLSYFGIVHPHVAVADSITKAAVPLFSKVKTYEIFSPSVTFPKVCSYSLKTNLALPVSVLWTPALT